MDALLGRLSCRAGGRGREGENRTMVHLQRVTGPSLHVIIVDSVIEADHVVADEPVVRQVRRRTTRWKPWKTPPLVFANAWLPPTHVAGSTGATVASRDLAKGCHWPHPRVRAVARPVDYYYSTYGVDYGALRVVGWQAGRP